VPVDGVGTAKRKKPKKKLERVQKIRRSFEHKNAVPSLRARIYIIVRTRSACDQKGTSTTGRLREEKKPL
jgi:hypothetical protein